MSEYVLREFVCKECDHKVVVNPNLSPDYTPNICTPCWERVVKPKLDRNTAELVAKAAEFLNLLGMKLPQ